MSSLKFCLTFIGTEGYGELSDVLAKARERKTCLVIDEIHTAQSAISPLLEVFQQRDTSEPFVLILAGDRGANGSTELQHLITRSYMFDVWPLSDPRRKYDIPFLAADIVLDCSKEAGKNITHIHALAMRELLRCDYEFDKKSNTGNIRALEAVIRATVERVEAETITWEHLPMEIAGCGRLKSKPYLRSLDYSIEIKK